MSEPRFQVATVTGWTSEHSRAGWRKGKPEPTTSATVCDTLYLWRELKTYRAEDQVMRNGERTIRGSDAAVADAQAHADYLNALHGDL